MSSFLMQTNEMLARLKPFGITFEKSLLDLIKGIRAHSKVSPESLRNFLDSAIDECKNELATTDMETKAIAVLKLAYLEMYGYDMLWCNFQILEVMSSGNFQHKRIGYLAAIQSFKQEQDLLILATNQFKKDLNSHNHIEVGLALSGIATIVTPNLSKDITDDVVMKLNHSSAYIRKKAILTMYKIFIQYPDSLRINFNRVIELLDDPDVAVVNATINVVCEISKRNPNVFVSYLPKFFTILESTDNNWLIIRILKLFSSLSQVEPRMKKKILPVILDMIRTTDAYSLKYECINCVINGNMLSADSDSDKQTAVALCDVLTLFFRGDANLNYVGLAALVSFLRLYPSLVYEVNGVANIIKMFIKDTFIIIKRKALEVCHLLVNEENMEEIVGILLQLLVPQPNVTISEALRIDVANKIVEIARMNNYSYVLSFENYIDTLKGLIETTLLVNPETTDSSLSPAAAATIAVKIGDELTQLACKVPSIRPQLVDDLVLGLLLEKKVLDYCPTLLKDLYWIVGEYLDDLGPYDSDEEDESPVAYLGKKIHLFNTLVGNVIDVKLGLTTNVNFPTSLQLVNLANVEVLVVLVQALVKIFSGITSDYVAFYAVDGKLPADKVNELHYYLSKLIGYLSKFETHSNHEVQERVLSWLEFLKLVEEALPESSLEQLEKDELEYYRKKTAPAQSESDSDESDESDSEESDEYDQLASDNEPEDLIEVSETQVVVAQQPPQLLPALLTEVLPSFFKAYALNPISYNLQKNIPVPDDLDLDTPFGDVPTFTLSEDSDSESVFSVELVEDELVHVSHSDEDNRRKERLERIVDDPYYITTTKKKKKKSASPMELSSEASLVNGEVKPKKARKKTIKKEKVVVLTEETIAGAATPEPVREPKPKAKGINIKIDLSNLENFDLNANASEEALADKDFEYNVDLEEMRTKLAQDFQLEEKKAEKKKKKTKKPKDGEVIAVKPKKKKKKAAIIE